MKYCELLQLHTEVKEKEEEAIIYSIQLKITKIGHVHVNICRIIFMTCNVNKLIILYLPYTIYEGSVSTIKYSKVP
jgi:hypothetical protein